jgi:glycine betaine/proline transport system substrate-binding protein
MRTEGRIHRAAVGILLVAALAAAGAFPADAASFQEKPDVIIGWTAWADAEVVSKMAAIVLSQGMKLDVELTLSDIAVQYRGVAEGNLDVMLMSWQPKTHEDYLRRYGKDLVDLGVLYEGATLGWVIPDYVDRSRIAAIGDLAKPDVRTLLQGKIQGIGKTAGIMRLSRKAIEAYGLDGYELVVSSGPAMARAVGRAVEEKRAIVATGWRPHWKFAEYPLRYLEDPKGIFDGAESVHAMARKGFKEDHPEAAAFFGRMHLSLDALESIMAAARKSSHREAILDWIGNHRDTVQYWMTGK